MQIIIAFFLKYQLDIGMNILHVVIKNTSSIDFTLPIFWYLRKKNPDVNITILYCVLDKEIIVPKKTYYNKVLEDLSVSQLDLIDFVKYKHSHFFKFFSHADLYSSSEDIKKSIYKFTLHLMLVAIRKFFKFFISIFINMEIVSNKLKADIILMDNRNGVNFIGDKKLFKYFFETLNKPIVILPHAPHYVDQYFSHVPVNPFGMGMYKKCDIWMPFLPATPAQKHLELEKQLFYSGYPGFDSSWINKNKSKNKSKNKNGITVLYIGRKFFDKNKIRSDGCDFVTMDYSDVLNELNAIHDSLVIDNCNYLFVYKPHPSSSMTLVKKVLNDSRINNYKVGNDAIYSFIGCVDLVISPYSTALFIFAISNIPTIILQSKMMNDVMIRWKDLSDLYGKMSYFTDIKNIDGVIKDVFNNVNYSKKDIAHLRKYFPDNNLSIIAARLQKLL
jgi:hypothetical protein